MLVRANILSDALSMQVLWNEDNQLYLRIEVGEGAMCRFAYSTDGHKFRPIGKPFKAKEGKWIGAKFGLFAVTSGKTNDGGWIDVDWVRVE